MRLSIKKALGNRFPNPCQERSSMNWLTKKAAVMTESSSRSWNGLLSSLRTAFRQRNPGRNSRHTLVNIRNTAHQPSCRHGIGWRTYHPKRRDANVVVSLLANYLARYYFSIRRMRQNQSVRIGRRLREARKRTGLTQQEKYIRTPR